EVPTIAVPTLFVHARRDANTPIEGARLCRDLIPGARLVELDSDIHLIWLSDVIPEITDAVEGFVTTTVSAANDETSGAQPQAERSSQTAHRNACDQGEQTLG